MPSGQEMDRAYTTVAGTHTGCVFKDKSRHRQTAMYNDIS